MVPASLELVEDFDSGLSGDIFPRRMFWNLLRLADIRTRGLSRSRRE